MFIKKSVNLHGFFVLQMLAMKRLCTSKSMLCTKNKDTESVELILFYFGNYNYNIFNFHFPSNTIWSLAMWVDFLVFILYSHGPDGA